MAKGTITLPSKINLTLKVTRRRTDGYHELATFFLPLTEPSDHLEWSERPPGSGLEVTSDDPALPSGDANLAGQAALRYAARAGLTYDWRFHIRKGIPVAGGMGGGSSDAAGVLRSLNAHYRRLNRDELAGLALELGADVPFFLDPVPSWGRGVGEQLTPAGPVPGELPLLIAAADFPSAVQWAYAHLEAERIGPEASGLPQRLADALAARDWPAAAALLHNDLEWALFDKFPLLGILRDFQLDNGALACHVTGSGPTLFALAPDDATLDNLYRLGRAAYPGVRWFKARPWRNG